MPRVREVKSARASKKPRRCSRCVHEIQPGEPYRYIAKKTGPRTGIRVFFCRNHHPRGSDLLSGRAADLARIIEGYDDAVLKLEAEQDHLPDLQTALSDAAGEIEQMADEIRDSAQSLEDGFGHPTAQSEAMNETANELEQWKERIEEQAQAIENWELEEDASEDDVESQIQGMFDEAGSVMSEEPELNLTG